MDVRQRMGVDWTELAKAVREKDAKALDEYIRKSLSQSRVNYREVQRSLEEYCLSQVSFSERLEFIIHAVPLVKTSSQHMFLELLTPACVESASQDHLQSARHLFWKLVNGPGDSATKTNGQSNSDEIPHDQRSTGKERVHVQGSRAAVKLFMVFNMTLDEAGGLDRMRNEFVAPLLRLSRQQNGQGRALQPVLSLANKHPEVLQGFDTAAFLTSAVEQGQNTVAADIVQQLPHEEQKAFVKELLERKNLKVAANAVRTLQLQEDFPHTEAQYRDSVVKQLLGRHRWSMAAEWVADDPTQQLQVVQAIAAAGEVAMAKEYAEGFFGSSAVPGLDLSDEALRAAADSMDTVFVNSIEQLPYMQKILEASTFLTLDVEWKPHSFTPRAASAVPAAAKEDSSPRPAEKRNELSSPGSQGGEKKPLDKTSQQPKSPAATLQVAANDLSLGFQGSEAQEGATHGTEKRAVKVFVIDLLELGGSSELDMALAGVMASSVIPKIGLELTGDLSKLLRSYPNMVAFQKVLAILDLQPVWQKANERLSEPRKTPGHPVGLSSLSDALLGKPLDKSMQVSDWSRRPLSASQLHYAALDAAVQVHLLQSICSLGKLSTSDLVAMYSNWPPQSKKQRISQDAHNSTSQGPNGGDGPPPPGAGGSAGGGRTAGRDSLGLRGPSGPAGPDRQPDGGASCSMGGSGGQQRSDSGITGSVYCCTGANSRNCYHMLCSPQQDDFLSGWVTECRLFYSHDSGVTLMRSISETLSGLQSCADMFSCPAVAVPYCTVAWCASVTPVDECLHACDALKSCVTQGSVMCLIRVSQTQSQTDCVEMCT